MRRVIQLKDKLDILMRYYKYGEGIKRIAKNTGFSRNTVREYIREFEEKRNALIVQDPDIDTLSIIDNIVEKPKYDSSSRVQDVMKEEYISKIKGYLSDNEYKSQNGLRKQCMTAQDMHEALKKHGYKGSYPTTVIYVRELRNKAKEAFIKQIYEYGDVCEFDWGDVKLRQGDKIKVFKMAVFTLAKTNARIAFLYRREDTQAFIESHARFFEITKGVFKTMVYDNMKVAVAKFVGNHEKEATDALKKLSLFYGFKFRFCNIHSGNEKGHVERSVDVVRRKAFSECIDFSFEEAVNHLEKVLSDHNGSKLEEERGYLLPYPGKYETADVRECFVDKYSTIIYLNNRYSVPDHLVGKYVQTKAYIDEIIILYGKEKIATHKRLYGLKEWSVDIYHFIKTITRKPGTLKGSLALSQLQEDLKLIYAKYFSNSPKEFIQVLEMVGNLGKDNVVNKIKQLDSSNISVSFDNIKAIVLRNNDTVDNDDTAVRMLSLYDKLYKIGDEAI